MTSNSKGYSFVPPWVDEVKLPKDWHILINEDGSGSIVDRAGTDRMYFDYGVPEVDVIGAYDPFEPGVDGWIAHLVTQEITHIAKTQSKQNAECEIADPKSFRADLIIPAPAAEKEEQSASIPIPDQHTQACRTATLAADAKGPAPATTQHKTATREKGETR